MASLRISIVGFIGMEQSKKEKIKTNWLKKFPDLKSEWVNEDPEIVLFASGGSEMNAKELLKNNSFCILVADDRDNSYAAATEVKAYLTNTSVKSILLQINNIESKKYLEKYYKLKSALKKLEGKAIGLIGNVSPWLIASGIFENPLKSKFGITIKTTAWKKMKSYKDMQISKTFNETFPHIDEEKLNEAERVYVLIKEAASEMKTDAVSVECFSLVNDHKVTACLGLAKLNEEGFPAGCEGDIPSTVGLMLSKEITGSVAWMANIASITSDNVLFAHCTIAPNLIKNMNLLSHFESDEGLAVQGDFINDSITVFRFNEGFSKLFVSEGSIINRPKYKTACRTQIEVKLPSESKKKLQENPLGNHHIIIDGNWKAELETAANMKGIELV